MIDMIREILPYGAFNRIWECSGCQVTYVDTNLEIRTLLLDRKWYPNFWTEVPDKAMEDFLIEALKREAPTADEIRILYDKDYESPTFEWTTQGVMTRLPAWPRKSFLWAVTRPS
jgi:hypothetical protein